MQSPVNTSDAVITDWPFRLNKVFYLFIYLFIYVAKALCCPKQGQHYHHIACLSSKLNVLNVNADRQLIPVIH